MARTDAAPLGKIFKKDARKKLGDDPKGAARDAGASAELAAFIGGLKPNERKLLVETWDKMIDLELKTEVDDVTVAFL